MHRLDIRMFNAGAAMKRTSPHQFLLLRLCLLLWRAICPAGPVLIVMTLVGCTHPVIQSDAVAKFSQAVVQTRQQSQIAFHDANTLTRDLSIAYVLATTRPGMNEADFTPALDPQAVAAWDNAFAIFESYASHLQELLSPDRGAGFGNAMTDLGSELQNGQFHQTIPPGLATGVTQLGELLIAAKAEADAQQVMRKADPAIRLVLTSMADAIGKSNQSGVRGTIWSAWQTRLATGPVTDYSNAVRDNNNYQKKRAAIDAYLGMLDQRDAQLSSLASLRQALLLLADAHTAAALGSHQDVQGILLMISQQLDQTKSLFQLFAANSTSATVRQQNNSSATRSSNGG